MVVFLILAIVCLSTYFFSYQSRAKSIRTRLTNRAITTARLLSQSEIFNREMVERIDSLTTLSLKHKSVQAYNEAGKEIYNYSDRPGDSVSVDAKVLQAARSNPKGHFFTQGEKEAVAFHFANTSIPIFVICAATDEEGRGNLVKLKTILLFSLFVGIVIAFLGGYVFSGRLLRPIKDITTEVEEISAQNLARRIQAGKVKDEWYKMSVTLNDLLDRLQDSFELQRRFISNASHELSTPLTAISSQLEIALQRKRTVADYEKVIAAVLQDVQHMNRLTQTLLEFAKAAGNSGGLTINLVRVDEIIMAIPGIMQKQNQQYDVFLEFGSLPENEEDLLVFGNGDLLTVAIANIVANACKYSADRKAKVSFMILEKQFVIRIADKGQGIPREELSKIFQPFYRVDNSRTTPGFGLGLSLAYRIIKLHKGNIHVDSELTSGTVFTVEIPSAKKGGF
jgi:signal transduction histidine kinase